MSNQTTCANQCGRLAWHRFYGTSIYGYQADAINTLRPDNSSTVGSQLLVSNIYTPNYIGNVVRSSLLSNGQELAHLDANYQIKLGYGVNSKYNFIIGGLPGGGTLPGAVAGSFWIGMIGDLIWSPEYISGDRPHPAEWSARAGSTACH